MASYRASRRTFLVSAGALGMGALSRRLPAGGQQPESDIRVLLEGIRAQHDLPALAAAVVVSGRTVAAMAVGVRKYGDRVPVTLHDQFHLGSDTKSMTATLIGKLVEQGKLAWTTSIAEVFPRLEMRPAYRAVTLNHLLCHRSGIRSEGWAGGMSFAEAHRLPGNHAQQRQRYVGILLQEAPEAPPGLKFIYSNNGYSVAGHMAEYVAGAPWEALMRRWIFEPLGMRTAGFGAMGTPGRVDEPWQHKVEGNRHVPIEPGPMADNPEVIGPSGTVRCSIGDWARYVTAHVEGARGQDGLVSAATFRKLHTPLFGGDYAFGWSATRRDWGGRVLTHNGSNTQNYCTVWISPSREFAVMAATNQGNGGADKATDETAAALIGRFLQREKWSDGVTE